MQISINGTVIKLTEYDCSPLFVTVGDTVQTIDGVDHVEAKKLKRHISATTTDLYADKASELMQILKTQNLTLKYDDSITNQEETRIFKLVNSPSLKKKLWKSTYSTKYYAGTQLELQEKGAE